jgi:hypothetical protein
MLLLLYILYYYLRPCEIKYVWAHDNENNNLLINDTLYVKLSIKK